jgi:hypothetical protein
MAPGDTLVMRYPDGARPVRVIGERSGYLATWLPAGTVCAAPVMANGAPIRSVPLRERFAGERKTQLQAWEGQDAAEIRAEGERVAGMIERWDPPFSDGWEKWQPDSAWPPPKLSPDWTQ